MKRKLNRYNVVKCQTFLGMFEKREDVKVNQKMSEGDYFYADYNTSAGFYRAYVLLDDVFVYSFDVITT
jgi:hypothetical protein